MKHILLWCLIPLAAISCTKTSPEPVNASGSHSFSITASLAELESDDTKATGENVIRLKWAAGDKISVINVSTGKALGGYLTADAAGYSSVFSGTLTGTINTNDVLAFVYPCLNYAAETTFTSKSIDRYLQTTTKPDLIMIGHHTVKSSSTTFSGISVGFDFQMSFLRINLSELPVSTSLTSVKVSGLYDRLTFSISGGKLISTASSNKGYVEYTASASTNDKGSQTIFLGILASPKTDRTITVKTATSEYSATFPDNALSANKSYNTNASNFVSSYLTFKDPSVKSVCLASFDRNSDGMLSFLEAAAVTDLGVSTKAAGGNPFPTSILNFAELQFFHGLGSIPSFQNYNLLKVIAIPSQIKTLGNYTFKNCSALEAVISTSTTPPTLGTDVFAGCSGDLKIYVPTASVTAYKSAWPSLSSKIEDIAVVGSDFGLEGWSSGGSISGSAD